MTEHTEVASLVGVCTVVVVIIIIVVLTELPDVVVAEEFNVIFSYKKCSDPVLVMECGVELGRGGCSLRCCCCGLMISGGKSRGGFGIGCAGFGSVSEGCVVDLLLVVLFTGSDAFLTCIVGDDVAFFMWYKLFVRAGSFPPLADIGLR